MTAVVLITGASKGIGLEIARAYQQEGYRVFGTSRSPGSAPDVPFTLLALDVTSMESVQACVDEVIRQAGRIDILVNNAGYDLYGAAEETTMEALHAQMNANFYGVARMTQAVLPHMRRQRSGRIINMSSIGGLMSLPYNGAYAASKHALEGYSETLRYELRPFGISVSLVEPGSVQTDTLDTSILEVVTGLDPYQTPRSAMVRQMRETGRRSSTTPHDIARTLLTISRARQPRLRYPVGNLARWMPRLKAVLPGLFERFMSSQFRTDPA
ncbi:MAG: SDR family oxidoreductase [Pleurocapsa minor GSE-CHR-MK-17-07R]|jgi:NAD(P)-dependent dehydrogenase (short-subunit alcohol dehydrogenase family)|nr:SDR family oxidoreductase [Pleurocapsa minor GSE-CHR-MK 17-07R]